MAIAGVSVNKVSPFGAFWISGGRDRSRRSSRFGDLAIVLFLAAQILDGMFTYIGLRVFGLAIEVNPLIGWLIIYLGPAGALVSAKSAAIVAGAFLHLIHVHLVVALLTGLYLLVAIGPWTHLLFFF
jgi:hypothetical protein